MAVFHNWLDQIWRSDERTLYGRIPAHIERFGSFSAEICRKLKRPGENGIQICRSLRLEGLDAPLHLVIPD